ncbi:hypothetical protein [Leptonema illini]|uniref:Uncharacterized protein n=1 Tax=Leptonema illini DSM 21528 TaxID=929563 RepID=H2CJD2_9LEPT|nr:hypothetical protein [Leptonema illini]EHQ07089.1 hypothetical protein Lepil_2414 [Leptonema illini DSM 21528]
MADVENRFPPGWDEKKIKGILAHYENQTEEEAVKEDDAAFDSEETTMEIPKKFLPAVRRLLAKDVS